MFKIPTVVILGAGASHECGLPLGTHLRNNIAQGLKLREERGNFIPSDRTIYVLLQRRFKHQPVFGTGNDLALAARNFPSIDEVLHYFGKDALAVEIGKLAIVCNILLAENESKLAISRETGKANLEGLYGTWYDAFFSLAISGLQKEEMPQIFQNVSFINFNYDRTLECFLFHALTRSVGIEVEVAADIIEKMNIIRPYGSLGAINWRAPGTHIGGVLDDFVFERLKGIRTLTEAYSKDIKTQMDAALDQSRLVICLGFGFHEKNMELLSPLTEASRNARAGLSRPVFATVKDLHEANMQTINDALLTALGTPRITLMDMVAKEMLTKLRPSILNVAAR
jgi:hypothetical protein